MIVCARDECARAHVCATPPPPLSIAWQAGAAQGRRRLCALVRCTLSRRLCGSVQMKAASTSLTLFRPLRRLIQTCSSSLDSSWHAIQCLGGLRYLPQALHHCSGTLFGMPSDMSTRVRMQFEHMLDGFHTMGAPQVQQSTVGCVPDASAVDVPSRTSITASIVLMSVPAILVIVSASIPFLRFKPLLTMWTLINVRKMEEGWDFHGSILTPDQICFFKV